MKPAMRSICFSAETSTIDSAAELHLYVGTLWDEYSRRAKCLVFSRMHTTVFSIELFVP